MNPAIEQIAIAAVSKRIGLAITAARTLGDPPAIDLCPVDLHPNESFCVRFLPRWRSAEVVFVPGKFAGPLLDQMGRAGEESRELFAAFSLAAVKQRTKITMRVNGADVSPMDHHTWPSSWQRLDLQLRSPPQVIDLDDMAQMHGLIGGLVIPMFGMIATLIGVEEAVDLTQGECEGRAIQTLTTRYERKKVNREACIQLKGTCCAACGFDFEKKYGLLGAGYIEVHHTTPVSKLGPDYRINVENDLEPLCSNCHAMVHREEPPVAISRLREILVSQQQNVTR